MAALALTLAACAGAKGRLDDQYGEARVRPRLVAEVPSGRVDFWRDVEPVLESRCVVCHGCFDAPCQVKAEAPEGLDRGASKDKVFEPSRLLAAKLTRLFEDAPDTAAWREKGFHPVLNERGQDAEANLHGSPLYRMLELKKQHPLPGTAVLRDFDFRLDRAQVCPTIEEFDDFAAAHPTWGMPYGLPGLSDQEHETLTRWLEQGAEFTARPPLSEAERAQIAEWEGYLNRDGNKARLSARYIYEHLFMAHVFFGDVAEAGQPPRFFELVRSKTPPGQPVVRLSTRRPFDDPGVEHVYYRFERLRTTVLVKSHLPYRLDAARLTRYRQLFDADFEVKELPGYDPERSANPFSTFLELPVGTRYRFLLDDAHFIMDGFIKGPVCHGQTALNVINDRFWVAFVNPNALATQAEADFLAQQTDQLDLPAGDGSNSGILANYIEYGNKQKAYLKARADYLAKRLRGPADVTLEQIWDGDGRDSDAALTVFRHEDSATVVRGFVGSPPKTSWVVGYAMFERIHYLLVAGFDVFGNVGHQLNTRLYMDFLRMEGETNMLAFLPKSARVPLRDEWYVGAEDEAKKYINAAGAEFPVESGLVYRSMNPELEFYEQLQAHLAPVENRAYDVEGDTDPGVRSLAERLGRLVGGPVEQFSPITFIEIESNDGDVRHFSLLRDNWHTNITSLFSESDNRVPARDRFTLTRELVGAYPNTLLSVKRGELDDFAAMVETIHGPPGYGRLLDRFGVRRTNPEFWKKSDSLHARMRAADPTSSGYFDFNRLENR